MDDRLKSRVLEYDQVKGDRTEEVDAVIIGTGCGGGVVAKELSAAGWSVLLLERGGFYTAERGDFDQREDDMMAKIVGGRGFDTTSTGQLALTYGNNVGGASVHYWADTFRTPRDRLDRWANEHGIAGRSFDELLPHFERIEADLNVHLAPPWQMNRMNQLFEMGGKGVGIEVEAVPQARKGCINSGYCMQGCSYDAKQSQLVTYLPRALEKDARIFADCEATAVIVEDGVAVGVEATFLDRRTAKPSGHKCRIRARRAVIVAAGGFASAALLLRSKIPDESGQLGQNLQANPCPMTFARFDEDVVMWRGIPAAVGSMQHRLARYDEKGCYLEGGYLLHPNQLTPAMLAALLPGFGAEHRALMAEAHRLGSIISWIDEETRGSISLDDDGNPRWDFELEAADIAKVRDALDKQARMLLAAGALEVILPDAVGTRIRGEDELEKIATCDVGTMVFAAPHPAGACRMGDDPKRSVVNNDARVWGVQRLYVTDPSVFPSVVSVDPSETIMAFAAVAAERILANEG